MRVLQPPHSPLCTPPPLPQHSVYYRGIRYTHKGNRSYTPFWTCIPMIPFQPMSGDEYPVVAVLMRFIEILWCKCLCSCSSVVMTFIRSLSKETCGFQVPCSCNKSGAYCMRSSSTLSRSLVVMGRACSCIYRLPLWHVLVQWCAISSQGGGRRGGNVRGNCVYTASVSFTNVLWYYWSFGRVGQ